FPALSAKLTLHAEFCPSPCFQRVNAFNIPPAVSCCTQKREAIDASQPALNTFQGDLRNVQALLSVCVITRRIAYLSSCLQRREGNPTGSATAANRASQARSSALSASGSETGTQRTRAAAFRT